MAKIKLSSGRELNFKPLGFGKRSERIREIIKSISEKKDDDSSIRDDIIQFVQVVFGLSEYDAKQMVDDDDFAVADLFATIKALVPQEDSQKKD